MKPERVPLVGMDTETVMVQTFALLVGTMMLAQTPPPAPKETGGPLSGPRVEAVPSTGIVERDMTGNVKRLDESPARAALSKLTLDAAAKKAADAVLKDHDAALDRFVKERLSELAAIHNAAQSGNTAEALRLLGDLYKTDETLKQSAYLPQRLAQALDEKQSADLLRMVQEYMQAIIAEETAKAKAAGDTKTRPGRLAAGEYVRILGEEIKLAYERVIGQQVKEFEAFLKSLSLTPAQESKVRAIATASFEKSKGNPSRSEQTRVFWKIWAELDATQREALAKRLRDEERK